MALSPEITTIKVSKSLRNRISAQAAEQHQTAQAFLEKLLDDYDRRRRFDAVAAAMSNPDSGWKTETALWEAADANE